MEFFNLVLELKLLPQEKRDLVAFLRRLQGATTAGFNPGLDDPQNR